MMDEVKPGWMEDGKGILGDARPAEFGRIEFPQARITNIEPQLEITSEPLRDSSGGGQKSGLAQPFAVLTQQDPDNAGKWQAGVTMNSYLFVERPTAGTTMGEPIDGLLTAQQPPANDAGWKPMLPSATQMFPDVFWLEVAGDPDGGVSGTPTVKSLGNGDSFGGGAVEYTGSPPVQAFARAIIAVGYFANGSPVWIQYMTAHRVLTIDIRVANDSGGASGPLISAFFPEPY